MMNGNRMTNPSANGPNHREKAARVREGGATPSAASAADSASAPPIPPAATAPIRSNQMRQSGGEIWRNRTNRNAIAEIANESGQRPIRISSLLMFDSAW